MYVTYQLILRVELRQDEMLALGKAPYMYRATMQLNYITEVSVSISI